MSRTFPWHSTASPDYHNNGDCRAGNGIAPHARLDGTGGKPLCGECAALNRADRYADLRWTENKVPPSGSRMTLYVLDPRLGRMRTIVTCHRAAPG